MNVKCSKIMVILSLLLCLSAPSLALSFYFDDSIAEYNVDYVVPEDAELGLWIYEGATVNLLSGAHVQAGAAAGDIYNMGTLNIHGGVVDGAVWTTEISITTLYGYDLAIVDGGVTTPVDPAATQIQFISGKEFTLTGFYMDGTAFSMDFLFTAYNPENVVTLFLNQAQPLPDIQVYADLLGTDFGDVPVGEAGHTRVVSIYNHGNAVLTVSSIQFAAGSSPDFRIIAGPQAPFTVDPSGYLPTVVDFTIEYLPSAAGPASAVLQVASDDADEPVAEVVFYGNGVLLAVPPAQQIVEILSFYDNALANSYLIGYAPGKGNSAENRVKALRNMLESAGVSINNGDYPAAIDQLQSVEKKIDGANQPPDFVLGDAVSELHQRVVDLIAGLQM